MYLHKLFPILLLSFVFINCTFKTKTRDLNSCKNYSLLFNLDKSKFLGEWMPLKVSNNVKGNHDCISINVSNISETQVSIGIKNRKKRGNEVTGILTKSRNSNSFIGKYKGHEAVISVLDTDYKTYAVVYACRSGIRKHYYVGILGRNSTLPESKIVELEAFIKDKTGKKKMKNIKQDNATCAATPL